jgi:hypothetical protein
MPVAGCINFIYCTNLCESKEVLKDYNTDFRRPDSIQKTTMLRIAAK